MLGRCAYASSAMVSSSTRSRVIPETHLLPERTSSALHLDAHVGSKWFMHLGSSAQIPTALCEATM